MSVPAPTSSDPLRAPILPQELFDLVVTKVERSQLPTLVQVTKGLYRTLSPLLYRAVFIDSLSADPISCVAEPGQFPDGMDQMFHISSAIGMEGAVLIAWYRLALLDNPPIPLPLPDRFAHVTTLAISTHFEDHDLYCANAHPLIMPLLRTLQLIPARTYNIPESLDHCSASYDRRTPQAQSLDPWPTCPLVRHLCPRRVILGGPETCLIGGGYGLWTDLGARFPPPWLDELVVFIGSSPLLCNDEVISEMPAWCFLVNTPSTLKTLTLIFAPLDGASKWVPETIEDEEAMASDPDHEAWGEKDMFWTRLGEICRGQAQAVEIVGLELVDADWMGMSVEAAQTTIREKTKDESYFAGESRDTADGKGEGITFISREAYAWD